MEKPAKLSHQNNDSAPLIDALSLTVEPAYAQQLTFVIKYTCKFTAMAVRMFVV